MYGLVKFLRALKSSYSERQSKLTFSADGHPRYVSWKIYQADKDDKIMILERARSQ